MQTDPGTGADRPRAGADRPWGWRTQILVKDIRKIPLFIAREVATTGEVAVRGSTARHGTVHNTIQQKSMKQRISEKKIVKQYCSIKQETLQR